MRDAEQLLVSVGRAVRRIAGRGLATTRCVLVLRYVVHHVGAIGGFLCSAAVFADLVQVHDVEQVLLRILGIFPRYQKIVIRPAVFGRSRGQNRRLLLHVERQNRLQPQVFRDKLALVDENEICIESTGGLGVSRGGGEGTSAGYCRFYVFKYDSQ